MTLPGRMLISALFAGAVGACATQGLDSSAADGAQRTAPPLLATAASARPSEPLKVRSGAPQRYTVVPGDTLWDIAGRFLDQPWRWPEIWHVNPQIANPHRIYPGNVIELYYEGSQPRLRVATTRSGTRVGGTIKLSPQIREEALHEAVPTIQRDLISPFLRQAVVLDSNDWQQAPYLLAGPDPRVTFGARDVVYVRGIEPPAARFWHVYRPAGEYRHPETGESLGFYGLDVGEAELEADGDPATLRLLSTRREALAGDRLLPTARDTDDSVFYFTPKPVAPGVHGYILDVFDGISLIGQYHSVVLSIGKRDGVEVGSVLGGYQAGRVVRDERAPGGGDDVTLPDQKAGILMVYKTFDRVSYALVMSATRDMHVRDRVGAP
ncbi:LysM domain-containing protein [Plasticicumulans acidivorans]|uniref:LysM domain-containing protein n=2 Tax=Plasticicumulans acidivorans TaxID=886464 RepID=A0A317MYU4_9GAMM|nr:LysM domain-containing protein [Plasticicumulans acidivorans]